MATRSLWKVCSVFVRAPSCSTPWREKSLQPLRPEETFPALAPHVFYPAWDAAGTALLMETLGACFAQAASFRLSCRPEEEAVALLRRAVWGEAHA